MPSDFIPLMVGIIILLKISWFKLSFSAGAGDIAPIPPVFGPWSLSNALLWSWAVPKIIAVSPSDTANILASIPVILSSIKIDLPASPNLLFSNIWVDAFIASSTVSQTTTPLPAARPSAFTTQYPFNSSIWSFAVFISLQYIKSGCGILFLLQKFLEKVLDPSNWAAFADGPKALIPISDNLSFNPSTRGISGPIKTRSIFLSLASLHCPSISSANMG